MSANPTQPLTQLVRGIFAVIAVVSVVCLPIAALVRGTAGFYGAAVALGLVALLFGGSALLFVATIRHNPTKALAVLIVGAFARFGVYGITLYALSGVVWLDMTSLAAVTGIAVAVALAYELHALSRMPRLFWVHHMVTGTRPVPSATRS